jgi:hypothetical protein
MTLQRNKEVVEFRDGTKITVLEASFNEDVEIAGLEKIANTLNEAEAKKIDEEKRQTTVQERRFWFFRAAVYPKLCACSSREDGLPIPNEREAFELPSTEFTKWEDAVRKVNPHWFAGIDAALKKNQNGNLTQNKKPNSEENAPKPEKSKRRSRRH